MGAEPDVAGDGVFRVRRQSMRRLRARTSDVWSHKFTVISWPWKRASGDAWPADRQSEHVRRASAWRSISPTGRTISAPSLRLCACLGVDFDVIEPCGFPLDDRRIRAGRPGLWRPRASWVRHLDFAAFETARLADRRRLVLLSTAGEHFYHRRDVHAGRHPDAGQRERGRAGERAPPRRPAGARSRLRARPALAQRGDGGARSCWPRRCGRRRGCGEVGA